MQACPAIGPEHPGPAGPAPRATTSPASAGRYGAFLVCCCSSRQMMTANSLSPLLGLPYGWDPEGTRREPHSGAVLRCRGSVEPHFGTVLLWGRPEG